MVDNPSEPSFHELEDGRSPLRAAPSTDPHRWLRTWCAGPPRREARGAVILLHGRGKTALGILRLHEMLAEPGVAFLAPQAADRTWYPLRFLAPIEENEPRLSSAIAALDRLFDRLASDGIAPERVVLAGFSQGACLAAEYVARRPRRLGGVSLLIGGLFGPEDVPLRTPGGSLDGTPVHLCSSSPDPFVPPERVRETARIFGEMGARITLRLQEDAGHVITEAGVTGTRALIRDLDRPLPLAPAPASDGARARAPRPAPAADRPMRIRPTAP